MLCQNHLGGVDNPEYDIDSDGRAVFRGNVFFDYVEIRYCKVSNILLQVLFVFYLSYALRFCRLKNL